MPSTAPLLRFKRTTIWSLDLWKSHCLLLLGTLVPLGKNQLPLPGCLQQAVWLVTQRRALPPPPMSSRATQLLFWYVVPLSENQKSPAPVKFECSKECTNALYIFPNITTFTRCYNRSRFVNIVHTVDSVWDLVSWIGAYSKGQFNVWVKTTSSL